MDKLILWAKDRWFVLSVIVLLSGLLLIGKCNNNKLEDKNQLQAVELSSLNDSVTVHKSKNGDLTAKIASVMVESDNRKKALEAAGFEIKDLRKRDIAWRDINAALQAKLEAAGHGQTVLKDTVYIIGTDTIKSAKFKWSNRFLFLDGSIIEKDMKFSYLYKADLSLISEKKGKNYLISAYISDPSASITTANSITIIPKKRWWDKPWLWGIAGLTGGYFLFK